MFKHESAQDPCDALACPGTSLEASISKTSRCAACGLFLAGSKRRCSRHRALEIQCIRSDASNPTALVSGSQSNFCDVATSAATKVHDPDWRVLLTDDKWDKKMRRRGHVHGRQELQEDLNWCYRWTTNGRKLQRCSD